MSILRRVRDEKEKSEKAIWLRNKYIGVWSQGYSLMSRMMRRFHSTMVMYLPRKRAKNTPAALARSRGPGGGTGTLALVLPPHIAFLFWK